jgi:CheY-like chemotaxis protein
LSQSANRKPVILVVEDEVLLRMDAIDLLEEAGFEVLDAANADEAIVLLETRMDIAVVFTDLQMPGSMDGLKLAAAIRDRWPPVKVIATSGHYDNRNGYLETGERFLLKPYSGTELTNAVSMLVNGS